MVYMTGNMTICVNKCHGHVKVPGKPMIVNKPLKNWSYTAGKDFYTRNLECYVIQLKLLRILYLYILHSVSLRNFLNSWAHMGLTVKLMQFNDVYTVIKSSVHKIICVAILVCVSRYNKYYDILISIYTYSFTDSLVQLQL